MQAEQMGTVEAAEAGPDVEQVRVSLHPLARLGQLLVVPSDWDVASGELPVPLARGAFLGVRSGRVQPIACRGDVCPDLPTSWADGRSMP